ncbi:MAG: low molecular weight phosphotyrosine protein phosphatase, partial [Bacteroidales bacterium]|nr:low molecular weight phosphotyrosine protein phosphatase [Bacteroidales bacterium]
MKILMICQGNICRSPMAEGILQKKLQEHHLDETVKVDSCGFDMCHQEKPPHPLSIQTAKKYGIDIEHQRQRLFSSDDFDTFDRIYVMDKMNYSYVERYARNAEDMRKVDYIRNMVYPQINQSVPDPWCGTVKDFEYAFQLIDEACNIIVEKIK